MAYKDGERIGTREAAEPHHRLMHSCFPMVCSVAPSESHLSVHFHCLSAKFVLACLRAVLCCAVHDVTSFAASAMPSAMHSPPPLQVQAEGKGVD